MDRKSILIIVASLVLIVCWQVLVVNRLYPPKPGPKPGDTNALTTASRTNGTNIARAASNAPSSLTPEQPEQPPSLVAAAAQTTNAPEQLLELTNANCHFTFTSQGGGLKVVELLKYPETISTRREKGGKRGVATLNAESPVPTLAVNLGDAAQSLDTYTLTPINSGVRAERVLSNGVHITKEFTLSTNYLLEATMRLENRGSNTVVFPREEWIVGTAAPLGPQDSGMAVGAAWYDGRSMKEAGASFFSTTSMGCIPRTPPSEYKAGDSNVVWVTVHNQFFTLAVMPEQVAQSVIVQKLPLPRVPDPRGRVQNGPPPAGYIAAMTYSGTTLAPGKAVERRAHVFAGPKEYQTLAKLGNRFQNNIDVVMGFGGFFGFFAKALLLTMNWLHDALRFSYGWAIIAITIIIKVLFWPLTQASTRSMKRMQALQPQMKAIQAKYKDDPAKMNRKTMEFMKEHKVSPLGGCLPMLLQIPVFFGFYRMIQSAIELRGASFLWVGDLSKPDTLFIIPGTNFPFNLLPLLMGATMLWQARLTPPSPGMDPAQAKIMKYMPLMFMVFLYNFSAGLTLYWTVQNLLTIAQTKLTKTNPEPGTTPAAPVLTAPPKKRR